jgi:hypothetical protein
MVAFGHTQSTTSSTLVRRVQYQGVDTLVVIGEVSEVYASLNVRSFNLVDGRNLSPENAIAEGHIRNH